jgi:hypothetical protein
MRWNNQLSFAWRQGHPPPKLAGALLAGFVLLFIPGLANARGDKSDRKGSHQQVERSVPADPRVVVNACLISGNATVHGWERKEVRARVSDGVQIELTRTDQTRAPVASELKLTTGESRRGRNSECLHYGNVEFDVPRGAAIKLQTTSGDVRVTDVAQVSGTSQGGSITLTNVHGEVNVTTIGGEISVNNSTGSFKLHSIGGTIDARNLSPATGSDVLEAGTVGGDVTLNRVAHQRVRVNTISGELDYAGALSRSGHYSFQSISGRLRLLLPAGSSFRLSGSIGPGGDFSNDFGLKNNHADDSQPGATRRLDDVVGNGDATINISFFSGSIQIKKQ